jgi:hypothetical protein
MAKEWFKQLPHFQVAYFQVQDAYREEKSFEAWRRAESEPQMVDGLEVWNISPWN